MYKDENKITPEILETKFNIYNKKYNIENNNEYNLIENKNKNIINKKYIYAASVTIPILYAIFYLINVYNNSSK